MTPLYTTFTWNLCIWGLIPASEGRKDTPYCSCKTW